MIKAKVKKGDVAFKCNGSPIQIMAELSCLTVSIFRDLAKEHEVDPVEILKGYADSLVKTGERLFSEEKEGVKDDD